MTAILLKFVHIVAIALWSAGLICLPFLYRQRKKLSGHALYRLHNFTRFFYVALTSPAAFVAVGSGIALIFVEATFEPWFAVKLGLVGVMVIIHVTSGLKILHLFEPGRSYPAWRLVIVSTLTLCVVTAILVTVLGKPLWTTPSQFEAFFAPGALGEALDDLIAWSR